MKLDEHRAIVNSPEETARVQQINAKKDQNKAKAARRAEKEKITAIGYKLIGNGFHSG